MPKIRLRIGEYEIELDGDESFIRQQLNDFYSRVQSKQLGGVEKDTKIRPEGKKEQKVEKGKEPSPVEFYKQKGSKTEGVQQILVFGKYLETYRNLSEFSIRDINELAQKEVKLSKKIHSQFFINAVKQGLLRNVGRGKYSLTLSAEDALRSM
jgi:glycosylphosphatidylinositol transamidase (GPIT) subunit GPI8